MTDVIYMTEAEAAKMLKISAYSLAELRKKNLGPPFVRLGGQVRYIKESIHKWAKTQERVPPPQELRDLAAKCKNVDTSKFDPDAYINGCYD